MAIDSFPRVEELTIARFVGPLALSRGRNYARSGNVGELSWDAPQHRLTASVQGSDPTPYRCSVSLDIGSAGRTTILGSTCSCPVGFTCKHAAAALFAANEAAVAAAKVAVESQRSAVGAVDDGWRGDIAALTAQTRGASTAGSASGWTDAARRAPSENPLALQFELRQRVARRRDSWQSPRDATAGDAATVERLAVRPVTMGARGGWIKGALTWQNVGFQGGAGGFDSLKARWFAQFSVLKGPVHGGYLNFGSDWISLDDFESSLLWALLTDADRLGIPLVGSGPTPTIRVAGSASIGLDARFGANEPGAADVAADDALTLTPSVLIDGVPHPTDQVRLIGTHGVYHYDFEHGVITLARLGSPITPEQRAVVERQRPVRVPQPEVAEFLESHYSALARTLRVVSSDSTFTPPPQKPATLVLTARFEAGHVLRLLWEWSLSDGRRAPLSAPDSEFHDAEAERAVVGVVEDILHDDVAGSLALGNPVSSAAVTPSSSGGLRLRSSVVLRTLDAAEFSARILPELERVENLHIDIVGQQPDYREVVEAPVLTVSAVETEENDWFDLGVVVTVEGRTVPFGPLFTALSNGRKKLLLVDNSYLSLDQPVFEPLRELIEEAGTLPEWEAGIRISRYQTDLWDEFEELADVSEAAAAWKATVEGLRDLGAIEPLDAPAGLAIELRHYQLEGFRWLAFLHQHRLGGILADDMGLGKTAQTLALIAHVVEQSTTDAAPFLVVAPTSVLSNWATEAARFTPGLKVVTVDATQGKTGRRLADAAAGADIVLTTYAILRIDAEVFADLSWGGLVLDEAQFAKNHTSKVHQAARGIRAPFRLAVTGTPMENNLMELWALFQIVAPGLFPSARQFTEKYRRPIEGDHNTERLAKLRRRIRPLMLRRSKELVAPELPPKQEQVLSIELDPRHRRIYDTHLQRERQKLLGLIEDLDRNRFIVFRSLTLLRMLSLDAALIDEEKYAGVPSAKLDALFEQLDDVVAEGHQALVFSQFTSFLQRAAARLDELGVPYAYLDGSTRSRGQVIERFRGGEAQVFLISLKAGGFGLNLTEADYVFLLDPWWNPASEAQAVDRAHRIGQDKTVMVYRMVASGTIEEKVMALKAKKAELVNSVMDDEALFSESLTADDIRGLLEA
ncbi:DEAD/DEAH box helicase [Leifsonia flava]|nr:DEAD/DEAH box helicase [Leifsonia flava]